MILRLQQKRGFVSPKRDGEGKEKKEQYEEQEGKEKSNERCRCWNLFCTELAKLWYATQEMYVLFSFVTQLVCACQLLVKQPYMLYDSKAWSFSFYSLRDIWCNKEFIIWFILIGLYLLMNVWWRKNTFFIEVFHHHLTFVKRNKWIDINQIFNSCCIG